MKRKNRKGMEGNIETEFFFLRQTRKEMIVNVLIKVKIKSNSKIIR